MPEIKTYYQVVEEDPNDYIMVTNSPEEVTPNFLQRELFNPKVGLSKHPLSIQVIECLQAVRDFTGIPIRVNSTYRNYIPMDGVSPASISPHMMAQAIDFSFIGAKEEVELLYVQIREDFDQKGILFQLLWDLGCRGFGSYDTFIHIDTTVSELYEPFRKKRTTSYQGNLYARWNKMKVLRYRTSDTALEGNPISNAVDMVRGVVGGYAAEVMDAEDRGEDVNMENGLILGGIIAVIVFLFAVPFLFFK